MYTNLEQRCLCTQRPCWPSSSDRVTPIVDTTPVADATSTNTMLSIKEYLLLSPQLEVFRFGTAASYRPNTAQSEVTTIQVTESVDAS